MIRQEASRRSLAWSHGVVTVEALGGMIGASAFVLPDGRQVSPLHIAPWWGEALGAEVPALLRGLRGEWPCVPFGADAPRDLGPDWAGDGVSFAGAEVAHGHGSHVAWAFLAGDQSIEMACRYPEDHPIKGLHRSVRPDPVAAALDITLTITARRSCRLTTPCACGPSWRSVPD